MKLDPWYTRVTTRGMIVGAALLILLMVLGTYATRDVCWIGTDAHQAWASCKYLDPDQGGNK